MSIVITPESVGWQTSSLLYKHISNVKPEKMESIALKVCFRYLFLIAFLGPVICSSSAFKYDDQTCGKTAVDDCLKNLQTFLRIRSLPFTSDEQQLSGLCNQTIQGYNCSQFIMTNPDCISPKDKALMSRFISMAEFTMFMFCGTDQQRSGYLRSAFLENSECVLKNIGKINCCADGTNVSDLPVMLTLEDSGKSSTARKVETCCPLSRYMKCVSNVIEENCSKAASNFTVEYIRRAAGEPIQLVCQDVPQYPEPDSSFCSDPVPECASGSLKIHLDYVLLFTLLSFAILSFYKHF